LTKRQKRQRDGERGRERERERGIQSVRERLAGRAAKRQRKEK